MARQTGDSDVARNSNLTRRRVLQAGASGLLAATVGTGALTATAGAVTTAQISPTDGFADVGTWLEDEDTDVYRIQEPTRSAVEEAFHASGPRVVIFETSGTIDLGGEALAITEDKCWVAGQTAPSPGITFVKGMVQVDADDCVVQHIRFRHGPGSDGEIQSNDSLNTADGTENNVIDHVTASWGTDECLSVGYDTTDTTVTNCLVYEGLYDPYGDGSDHNYATLVGDGAENVTLAGNVWAKCRGRVPRLKSETRSVVANNVMYFFNEATNMDGDTAAAIVGNVYIPQDVEDTPIEDGNASLSDNVTEPSSTPLTGGTEALSGRPLWPAEFDALDASAVESHNLSNAGARPADRTDNDDRIVSEIRDRAGDDSLDSPYDYWIPHPDAVGGYPDLPVNTHSLSVPDAGLREWLAEWAAVVEDGSGDPDTGGGESDRNDDSSGSGDGSRDATSSDDSSERDDDTSSDDLIAELDPGTTDAAVGEWVPFAIVDTTDSDHWITGLSWSFGDGTTATGWWNAHTYESAGTYTVALTATNDAGESTTHEVIVTVS
ncbi:chitinase protein [Halorhabdus tiamatea SARL4B]|uniref:Chitinase protein n=1 Tax=Halorhabdus tiamatea SARL4B TaxID=1033806 RepID=S6D8X8_9EURY|nr:PKD domain-containing protein [Halorhabdus tiamatea]ERJ04712.1 chitinase protein [Halorhabdus tiamatea SARL4B]CCQ34236.1 pectate lyase, family PL1 [Halorhabdus tiamatea SARL4B]